jgi:alkyl sulfatase BDS1-like metallo-beta-lactamase superfamily hydrolase
MTSVADAVKAMQAKFNPAAAAGLDLVFGFNITDEDKQYSLIVKTAPATSRKAKTRTPTARWCWTAKP